MIYHVFDGTFYLLNRSIIEQIFTYCTEHEHRWVIFLPEKLLREQHQPVFDQLGIAEDQVRYLSPCCRPGGFVGGLPGGRWLSQLINSMRLYFTLRQWQRGDAIVFHGSTYALGYLLLSMLDRQKVAWICWSIKTKTLDKPHSLATRLKIGGWKKLKAVNCLMTPDQQFMESLGLNNVATRPYIAFMFPPPEEFAFAKKILLGNNAAFANDYLDNITGLAAVADIRSQAAVGIMAIYGVNDSNRPVYEQVVQAGTAGFGDRFVIWHRELSLDEYMHEMAQWDIYICSHMTQSGLGAIYAMLHLGKKIFLSGFNLSWVRSLGFVVYDYSESLALHPELFLSPLPDEQKQHNQKLYADLFSPVGMAKKWNQLFDYLKK